MNSARLGTRDARKTAITVVALITVLLVSVSLYWENLSKSPERAKELEPITVKEYEGKKLSSIDDFRENSIMGPQKVEITNYKLTIRNTNNISKTYTYEQIINSFQKYNKVVTLDCVEGWGVTIFWEGILVRDVIGRNMTTPEAKVVIFRAYDGYTTSLPLDYIMNKDIIMAVSYTHLDAADE